MNRTTPRTDCPKTLPSPPKPQKLAGALEEHEQPMNDLQKNLLAVAASLNGAKQLSAEALGLRTEQEGVCKLFDVILIFSGFVCGRTNEKVFGISWYHNEPKEAQVVN